jgi:hypothetical protein
MSFGDFIIDEEEGNKKRKVVEDAILEVVKPALIDTVKTDAATIIQFKASGTHIKETIYEVVVCIDYIKKIYRGMHRAIYVNIKKESNSYRETDYIAIDLSMINDAQFLVAVQGIKDYFKKLVPCPSSKK